MFGGLGGVPRKPGKASEEPKLGVIAGQSLQPEQGPPGATQTPHPRTVDARVEPIVIGKGASDSSATVDYRVEPIVVGSKNAGISLNQKINAAVSPLHMGGLATQNEPDVNVDRMFIGKDITSGLPRSAPAIVPAPRRSIRDLVAGRTAVAVVGSFKTWHWGQHPDEAYMADALESIGVPVIRLDASSRPNPDSRAGWVVFTGQPESRGNMARWEGMHATILWTLDWLPYHKERRPVIEAARRAALFVSSDRYDWSGLMGIQHHAYLAAACEGVDTNIQPGVPWRRPCAFMGSLYSERRKKIAGIIESMGGEVRGAPGTWIYGADLARYVQETKVVVGDNILNDIQFYWSSRNYVVPGAGGFLLTPRVPGLETHLKDGVHVACYESLAELEGELRRWIADDDRRETIRKTGFLYVRQNHNWKVRAHEFMAILDARLKEEDPR